MITPAIPGKTSRHQVRRSCGLIPDQMKTIATPIRSAMCDFFISSKNQESRKKGKEFRTEEAKKKYLINGFFLDSELLILFRLREFNRQIDCSDHAVGLGDSF